jgi:TfoX/Sxy family transcriptional regulator of competence genes
MVASDGFAEFLRDQLAPLGRITMRRMFGKTGVFCDGFMLGMVRTTLSTSGSTTKTARPSRKPSPFHLSTTRRREAP